VLVVNFIYVFTEQITFILSNAVLIYNLENASS